MILAAMAAALLSASDPCGFLFGKGSRWLYRVEVEYTLTGSNRIRSSATTWKMAVLATRGEGDLLASVVRGWVDQLPWFEPGREPAESLAVCSGGNVYVVGGRSASARDLFRGGPTQWREAIRGQEPALVLPLRVGANWGVVDPSRVNTLYRWNVESVSRQKVPGVGSTPVFRLRYQSLPDHEILDIAPTAGVVGYVYEHHGTVSHVELRLRRFETPRQ